MALSKYEDLVNAQAVVPCNVCDDEEPGEHYCIECKQTLCSKCEKSHRKVFSTKDHIIILRTRIDKIKSEVLICTDHGEPASVHCEKCNLPVCIKCVTENHQAHKMVPMADIVEKKKELLQSNIDELQQAILPELVKKKAEIVAEQNSYEATVQEHTEDVVKEKENLLRGLAQVYEGNLKSLNATRLSHIQVFEKSTREIDSKIHYCEKRISEIQDIIQSKNFCMVINFPLEKEPIAEIRYEPKLPKPPVFNSANVENMIESVRKLRLQGPSSIRQSPSQRSPLFLSTFKSILKGASSIAITNEGNVWLGGTDTNELVMVNLCGEKLSQRNIQFQPSSLAVMKDGSFIFSVCTSKMSPIPVNILLTDGRECSITDPLLAFGVSVTPHQKILICTQEGKVLRADNPNTIFKDVYAGSGYRSAYHAVEDAKGHIFVSDRKNSKVIILDKECSVVSELKKTSSGEKLGKPVGLVLDKKGNILFADKGNDCVYIIDQNQQIRELVGRSQGISKPRFLAFDGEGHLWITSFDETIKIVKFSEDYR